MYKIVELNERDISHFKGKIIQVIDSRRREVRVGTDYLGCARTEYLWVLTCLVEEE